MKLKLWERGALLALAVTVLIYATAGTADAFVLDHLW